MIPKASAVANINSSISVKSGDWVKIGKITEGLPLATVTYTNNGIISAYDVEADGTVYILTEKKGTISARTKLSNGKQYTTTKLNAISGEHDFMATVTGYNTCDNCFTIKIKNLNILTKYRINSSGRHDLNSGKGVFKLCAVCLLRTVYTWSRIGELLISPALIVNFLDN